MLLTKMSLKGFKSFANPTVINFKDGLTVIVGPNGSGKSNISDALKWVLGEISKKNLRAINSKDIIFSGTEKVSPAEFAEVSLYFDNHSHILDYATDTVVVTRKIYLKKDKNEYFINNELVRRKDIKNLFLDTGLGNFDLSIISQGSVSKVVESKPEQLRELLLEAAAVSKYQQRKKEAIAKLDVVSVNLGILEVKLKTLTKQLKPLKGAKEKAERYQKSREKLSKLELPLIKELLEKNYQDLEKFEKKLTESNFKKVNFSEKNHKLEEEIHDLQGKFNLLDKEIDQLQIRLNELQNSLQKIEKFDDDEKETEKKIKHFAKSIYDLKKIIKNSSFEEEKLNQQITDLKTQQFDLTSNNERYNTNLNRVNFELEKIEQKANEIGFGTLKILENRNLFKKVYGTVQELIKFEQKHHFAIFSALAGRKQNLVVSNQNVIEQAIKFLKENKLGTATFIPNEQIKGKDFPKQYLNLLQENDGFLGTLDSFIKVEKEFSNLPSFLAANILLFKEINSALSGAKTLNYRYMIVTLDGDLIYPGFTVKGGYNKIASQQEEKKKFLKAEKLLKERIATNLNNLNQISKKLRDLLSDRNNIQNEEIRVSERLNYLETQLQYLLNHYKNLTARDFDFSKFENELANQGIKELSIEEINNNLKNLIFKRQKLNLTIIELQEEKTYFNKQWAEILEIIANHKILISDCNNMIEKNLAILHDDYKMSYDQLKEKKLPKIKNLEKGVKEEIEQLRDEIEELGFIDFESIEKYNQLSKEFNDLEIDVNELSETRNKLLSIIEVTDKEMLKRIKETFAKVNERFNSIFKMLFRGGSAKIIFTEPENILESGVEIIVSAPEKKIKTIRLYSGGEKSLIALSLIFAINEVNNLPILLLDEVEAALDEANVERFADFAKELNQTTQLIIITHRPGTMQKADYLYGVTMQTKGITDIFNLKIENAIKIIDQKK